jgi:hypothetical protein
MSNNRLKPEFSDPFGCLNMDVHSAFFVAIEEKPERPIRIIVGDISSPVVAPAKP